MSRLASQPAGLSDGRRRNGRVSRGALMVELAVALVVLGVLATLSFGTLGKAERDRQGRSAAVAVQAARQAVLDFALAHGRLPCPDLDGDGAEGDAGGACAPGATFARLPVHTLGLGDEAVSGTLVLRYGVARPAPDADLGTASVVAGQASVSPAHGLLARAERVAALGASSGQPYIPAVDASGRAIDCASPAARPAFVISAGERADVGASSCFPVPPPDRGALVSMGPLELAGWLRSKL